MLESDQSTFILVASGPPDEQVAALIQAIRKAGLRVTFASTANIAARASEAAACVTVLRPDTWKTQTIAVTMRAKPACLIPVLAEPMDLPRGPWTHEAISIGDEQDQAHQAVIQALHEHLAKLPKPDFVPVQRVNTDKLLLNAVKQRRRRRNLRPFITAILILLIVGLGALAGYRYYTQTKQIVQSTNSSFSIPTATSHNTYITRTPGPGCDGAGGQWDQGKIYKIKLTPTASPSATSTPTPTGTPSATSTPTEIEVLDKYTTLQCEADGALLGRIGAFDVYSEIFFNGFGLQPSIARHSLVTVEATVISGDAQANITIDTHIHDYGRYSFHVNSSGHWEANTGSTVDGGSINRLAIGFLPKPAKTYTLALETDGPVMTFSINGNKVAKVTDMTHNTDNDSIALGFDDPTWKASTPISALFSNFSYEDLSSSSSLSTPQVLATATTQAQVELQTPYSTHAPGYGCDQQGGQWQPLNDADSSGSLNCTSNGMQLTVPGNAQTLVSENFYLHDGHFPVNYKITAHIDVHADTGGCAGLGTRANGTGDLYAFIICSNGSWEISLVTDKFHTLDQGTFNQQDSYTLTAVSNGSTQSLFINNTQVSSVSNTQLKSTDYVSLLAGLYKTSQQSSVTFSDFSFIPLPS